jgi:hypothetical protein
MRQAINSLKKFFLETLWGQDPVTPASDGAQPILPAFATSGVETFGTVQVPADFVMSAALSHSDVREVVMDLRSRLLPILGSDAQLRELCDRMILRFAAFVMHLPASAQDHHSKAWGLLFHSLDAARIGFDRALSRRFEYTSDPAANIKILPVWQYLSFLFSLTHDVGKVIDVDVTAPNGEKWNPYAEPLASFYMRSGAPPSYSHRPKRDPSEHQVMGKYFLNTLLTPQVIEHTRSIFHEALAGESPTAKLLWSDVQYADTTSSKVDKANAGRPTQFLSDFASAIISLSTQGHLHSNVAAPCGVLIGDKFALLSYPEALDPIGETLKHHYPELLDRRERGLRLARRLHSAGALWFDRATQAYIVRFAVDGAAPGTCILVSLSSPELARLKSLGTYSHKVRFVFSDGTSFELGDFNAKSVPAPQILSSPPVPAPSAATPPAPRISSSSTPPNPVPTPAAAADETAAADPETPEVVTPPNYDEAVLDGKEILKHFKADLMAGHIPRNIAQVGKVFITPRWTYAVVPTAFVTLQARGFPNPCHPKGALYPYLHALAKKRFIWKHAERKNSVFKIKTPQSAPNHLHAIAFYTDVLFTKEELGKLGYWQYPVEHMSDPKKPAPSGGFTDTPDEEAHDAE